MLSEAEAWACPSQKPRVALSAKIAHPKCALSRHRLLSFVIQVQLASMKRSPLFLLAALIGLATATSAQDWAPLGPDDWNWPSVGKAYNPQLAIDDNNYPVIASKDYGNGGEYRVRRWDGAKWVALGSDGFTMDWSPYPEMVLDDIGNPVLAGSDPNNGGRILVRRWNGSEWIPVGVDGFSAGEITTVRLAKDFLGRFVVAYRDQSLDRHIVVKRWTGSVWEMIGDESFSDSDAYGVYLALDSFGNPVVAYQAYPGIHLTRVQRWIGTTWETMPPIDMGSSPVHETDLAIDANGNPIVALSNTTLGQRPAVLGWNGAAWDTIGTAGFSVGNTSDLQIDVDAEGRPVVLFTDYDDGGTSIRRWSGSSWEVVCGVDPYLSPQHPTMALDGNGDFIVACQSWGLGWRSHVQRWSGSEWLEFGERGFSSMGAYYTSLAMNDTDEIVVAYADVSFGVRTTVQRWNGDAWEVIGTTGISAGHAAYHALELDTLGYPIVAYADNVNAGLTVLRWSGSVWEPVGAAGFTNEYPVGLSMSLTSSGKPVIAYKVSLGIEDFYRIRVVGWDGSSWNEVGQFPNDWAEGGMSLVLDSSGNPMVGYNRAQYGGSRVVQWDGTEWNILPDIIQADWPYFQDLVLDAVDRPLVASSGTLYRWSGTSWLVIGSDGDLPTSYVCLAISDNDEIIAGGLVGGRATVKRWKGEYWEGVGSERFTTSFSDFQGAKWLQTDGHGRVVVAYTNGGMYAKSIEYSDLGIVIGDGVLNIGPNPSAGEELWISLGGLPATMESIEAELHDMSGRCVNAQLLPVAHGELNTRFALSPGLASGMYVASVYADDSRWSARLIVAKP